MNAIARLVVISLCFTPLSVHAETKGKAHKPVCGKSDTVVRALLVGRNFSNFKFFSNETPEEIPCKDMPRKSKLPGNVKAALFDTWEDLKGVWILNRYSTEVDENDGHTYKNAQLTFYSTAFPQLNAVESREDNHADSVGAFPKSKHPEDDKSVLEGIKAKPGDAFSDKKVRRVSVIGDWEDAGKHRKRASIVVGVFDAENSKCWVWNKITVVRPEKGGKVELEDVGEGTNEIDCKLLK